MHIRPISYLILALLAGTISISCLAAPATAVSAKATVADVGDEIFVDRETRDTLDSKCANLITWKMQADTSWKIVYETV